MKKEPSPEPFLTNFFLLDGKSLIFGSVTEGDQISYSLAYFKHLENKNLNWRIASGLYVDLMIILTWLCLTIQLILSLYKILYMFNFMHTNALK